MSSWTYSLKDAVRYDWSAGALAKLADVSTLVINPIIYAGSRSISRPSKSWTRRFHALELRKGRLVDAIPRRVITAHHIYCCHSYNRIGRHYASTNAAPQSPDRFFSYARRIVGCQSNETPTRTSQIVPLEE